MPIYEYACKKCDGEFEVSQRITDEPLKRYPCLHCGKRTAVTRLISRSAFHLKGGGWYATDYGKNGSKTSGADGTKDGEANSSETKRDTKDSPATSKEAASSTSENSSQAASSSAS